MISSLWVAICDEFARRFGEPLPNQVLELGYPESGWHVALNATTETDEASGIRPFDAALSWNGFPAGIVGPDGGVIAAGELANQQTFLSALPGLSLECLK